MSSNVKNLYAKREKTNISFNIQDSKLNKVVGFLIGNFVNKLKFNNRNKIVDAK